MAEGLLVDNDVALKVCAYRCHREMTACMTALGGNAPAVLAVARFSLRSRARRTHAVVDRPGLQAALEELLSALRFVEPTDEEIDLAADFEERTTRLQFEFDTGESQLLAVLLTRGGAALVTGDKRALRALAGIGLTGADGRFGCLEQLMSSILPAGDVIELRERVRSEPRADNAITACFSLAASVIGEHEIRAGLTSYVRHLRGEVGALLLPGDDLSAIIAQEDGVGGG